MAILKFIRYILRRTTAYTDIVIKHTQSFLSCTWQLKALSSTVNTRHIAVTITGRADGDQRGKYNKVYKAELIMADTSIGLRLKSQ